jgi:hypothetical protein
MIEVPRVLAETQRYDPLDIQPAGNCSHRYVGDTNYGSAAMLGWLVDEKKIASIEK